jgi:hypothetical protein
LNFSVFTDREALIGETNRDRQKERGKERRSKDKNVVYNGERL